MNEKNCTPTPKLTICSMATQLFDISGAIESKVDDIGSKLFGTNPCDETKEPGIGDLESALHRVLDKLETIAKKVYTIDERL
jgi:hypothetical protein